MLFVLAHEPQPDDRSPQARSLRVAADAARQVGLNVIRLPFPFADADTLLPSTLPGDVGVYSGPVPKSPGDYRALERALDARGATLLNSAAASEQVTRIEHWHTLLADVSAKTVVLRDLSDLAAASALGFPLFIKGLVKSAKEQGLAACVVNDDNELCARAHAAWQRQQTLVAREFLRLRQSGRTLMNFPQAREYRVTVLDADALATSFYWSQSDPLGELSDRDREAVTALALAVAARLEARVIAVDVAELEDGGWCVIEVGDAQHTGLAHIPPHLYWTALRDL